MRAREADRQKQRYSDSERHTQRHRATAILRQKDKTPKFTD